LVNEDNNMGYINMDVLWDKMANLAKTELIALWTDRIKILTENWDKYLFDYYNKNKKSYMVIRFNELKTWQWAYPITTLKLHKLIGIYKSTAVDAYIRYIAEITNIDIVLKNVSILRIPQKDLKSTYLTSHNIKINKKNLFRKKKLIKQILDKDIIKILKDKEYCKISNHTIDKKKWFNSQMIAGGPKINKYKPKII